MAYNDSWETFLDNRGIPSGALNDRIIEYLSSNSTPMNTLTVGTGGEYATIQEAIDYIATQPAFIQVIPTTPAEITSWTIGTSTATLSTIPAISTSNIGIQEKYWIKVTGDNNYYPVEGLGVAFGGTPVTLNLAMKRLGATIAVSTAFTWWRENQFTILLLDDYVNQTCNINTDMNVVIKGLTKTWLNGTFTMGATFYSGKVHLVGIEHSIDNISWTTANTVKLILEQCKVLPLGPDGYSPGGICGSVHFFDGEFTMSPSASRGHIFNIRTAGDFIIRNSIWHVVNANASGVASLSNAYLTDRINSRNVILDNIKAVVYDPLGKFSSISFIGDDLTNFVGADYIYMNDLSIWYKDSFAGDVTATTLNISAFIAHSGWTKGVFDINKISIVAPRTTATLNKKLVHLASAPSPITVNVGRSTESLPYDAHANITYNVL